MIYHIHFISLMNCLMHSKCFNELYIVSIPHSYEKLSVKSCYNNKFTHNDPWTKRTKSHPNIIPPDKIPHGQNPTRTKSHSDEIPLSVEQHRLQPKIYIYIYIFLILFRLFVKVLYHNVLHVCHCIPCSGLAHLLYIPKH